MAKPIINMSDILDENNNYYYSTAIIYRNLSYEPPCCSRRLSIVNDLNQSEIETKNYEEIEINSQKVQLLKSKNENGGMVYLIGTNHISTESRRAVEELISKVKPHIVMIELCKTRAGLTDSKIFTGWRKLNFTFLWYAVRELGLFAAMILLCMGHLEKFIAKTMNADYGAEMKIATSLSNQKAYEIFLGDRPSEITLKRMAAGLGNLKKFFMSSCVFASVFLGLKCATLAVPIMLFHDSNFMRVLVEERDLFLTYSLQTAINAKFEEPVRVVGIVGIGHVPGILNFWGTVTAEDVEKVMRIE